ncbi:MAG: ABC transporter ATP-binding protein [Oscillospiraceae bacterium]|nr:ABC transporter ATP-binding protein [Oscillospiraceae bacterium]
MIWSEFWKLLKSMQLPWFWMLLAFLCNMFYSEVNLLLPTTTAGLLSGSTDSKVLWDAIVFYILYTIVLCADTLLRCPAQHFAVRNVRRVLWKRMLNIRMDYYDANDPSKLMSTVTNDASDAVRNLVFYIVGVIPALYYAIRALSTISTYNVWLMVSVFMLLPIKILYMFYIGKRRFKTQKGLYQQIGGLTGYLAERVRNLSLIKTYTNEPQELKNGEAAAKQLFDANMKVVKLECTISALATGIGLAQNLIVMVFGVVLLQKGAITLPQWVAFFMFSGTISNTFDTIISYWTDLKTIQGSLARASHLMNVPVETEDGTTQLPDAVDITFENVSFAYGDKQALEDVSFTIPAGTTTAVVGLCGSGKTTLISLLERFYTPDSGCVKLGGIPVSQIHTDTLRNRFGYVQQGADIFGGTLREALTYGIREAVTDDQILEAAKRTGFDRTISLFAEGLDATVAPGGTSLSGGQRQKLVMTREFLRDADILLLDEPTSALDAVASAEIQDSIFETFAGKTKMIVTHDLSLLKKADQVVVLDGGRLVGCGIYHQLKETCPQLQQLLDANISGEERAV